ncbi:MAG: SagB/ThcOx family dehydrogenase [Desulfomonile sp.]|nr:SagB/ThcOx family dehydrogenase [Desulfomonile sp.]
MTIRIEEYHRQTRYARYDLGGRGLDLGTQPKVFKTYPGLANVPLPPVLAHPEDALSSVIHQCAASEGTSRLAVDCLAQIILLTHCLTAKARYGGEEFYYRSVASAGALYPFELYVGVRGVEGLADGLYHHSVELHALTLLRQGDVAATLIGAFPWGPGTSPPLIFFLTSIFYRSSWKYRDRAYRYDLLDTGHLAENLCLALQALRLPYTLSYDFDDNKVNEALCVDPDREVCLAVASAGGANTRANDAVTLSESAAELRDASRVAVREAGSPFIKETHIATSKKEQPSEPLPKMLDHLGLKMEGAFEKLPPSKSWPEVMSYAQAVFKRRSNRNFVPTELPARYFVSLMELIVAVHKRDHEPEVPQATPAVGVIVGSVQDVDPGFYLFDPTENSLGLVSAGPLIEVSAHACLDQQWLRNCALHFLFLANLEHLEKTYGPRGYRHVMLTAGRLGQAIYLGATAMRLGCCGIGAFYDDEAARMLGLNEHSYLLYLVGVGPLRKWAERGGQ